MGARGVNQLKDGKVPGVKLDVMNRSVQEERIVSHRLIFHPCRLEWPALPIMNHLKVLLLFAVHMVFQMLISRSVKRIS